MAILTVFYSLNGIYDKKNYLSGENRIYEAMVTFIRVVLALVVANGKKTDEFLKIYLSINVVCSFAMMVYFILFYPYNKRFVERYSLMWLTIYFV